MAKRIIRHGRKNGIIGETVRLPKQRMPDQSTHQSSHRPKSHSSKQTRGRYRRTNRRVARGINHSVYHPHHYAPVPIFVAIWRFYRTCRFCDFTIFTIFRAFRLAHFTIVWGTTGFATPFCRATTPNRFTISLFYPPRSLYRFTDVPIFCAPAGFIILLRFAFLSPLPLLFTIHQSANYARGQSIDTPKINELPRASTNHAPNPSIAQGMGKLPIR